MSETTERHYYTSLNGRATVTGASGAPHPLKKGKWDIDDDDITA